MNKRQKPIKFTKMHALGNDFMVINAITQTVRLSLEDIKALGNRHTGVGFDQCLIIEKSVDPAFDFFYRIFNANGTEVGQCGNGARALGKFLVHAKLAANNPIRVKTKTTAMLLQLNADDTITINFAPPKFNPIDIPLSTSEEKSFYTLSFENAPIYFHAVNVGNPHAVIHVDAVKHAPVSTLGPYLSEHPLFPQQTNVSFMEIVNDHVIRLRVYERGVGETLACGSAAVASALSAIQFHKLQPNLKVILPGGVLSVNWPNLEGPIYLTGDATFVYEGALYPKQPC